MAIKASNQISIVDVTDAYSVILSSEAYTFVGGTSGAASGLTCTTQAVAFCGTNQCSKVEVIASEITCPTGISASVSNSGSSAVTITFSLTATLTSDCEATIPVKVDGITVNKKFSFAVAKTGATGATGATGKGISKVETYYLTTASSSGVTIDTSGWDKSPTATDTTKKYIWAYQKTTYTDNSTSNSKPAIIGTHGATGATGAAGADAITLSITTSAGTVFKNNSGSTVLTAHVYKGGVEQSISDNGVVGNNLGSIKWYKVNADGSLGTAKATAKTYTAKTYTVSASDVQNCQAYTCQLEA